MAIPYPNPDRVAYPTGQPLAYPCQLTTRDPARMYPMHNHGAWLDAEGNGNTAVDAGHFHRVRGFKVIPDESDGHTHTLTQLPCGAGAPRTLPSEIAPGSALAAVDGNVAMMGAPSGAPRIWPWVVGAVVVVGVIVAGVMIYKHANEGGD